jgi:hypothetical protein
VERLYADDESSLDDCGVPPNILKYRYEKDYQAEDVMEYIDVDAVREEN